MADPRVDVTLVVAALGGLLLGSVPTADWLARLAGVDLRASGTGNPGANNARQLGGVRLGIGVLVVEMTKGVAAVLLGSWIGDTGGAALGGAAATAGNVYNPWFGLRGGKGLGITAGTLLAAWPALGLALIAVIGAATGVLRRTGPAALITVAVYLAVATLGMAAALPGKWLATAGGWMWAMAVVQSLTMIPKHLADTLRRPSPPLSRG